MTHTGGNGHAMEHRRQHPDHVLVAKMGTITPDGKGDVYCYGCDDDVLDEQLVPHLAQFGIEAATSVKVGRVFFQQCFCNRFCRLRFP